MQRLSPVLLWCCLLLAACGAPASLAPHEATLSGAAGEAAAVAAARGYASTGAPGIMALSPAQLLMAVQVPGSQVNAQLVAQGWPPDAYPAQPGMVWLVIFAGRWQSSRNGPPAPTTNGPNQLAPTQLPPSAPELTRLAVLVDAVSGEVTGLSAR